MNSNKYLIRFAQTHECFRIPELKSLGKIEGIELDHDEIDRNYNELSPFLVLTLKSDEDAIKLIKRGILIKCIHHLWVEEKDRETLHETLLKMEDYESEYNGKSFRFEIFTFGKSRTNEEKISLVNEFRYMKLNGKINLKDPEVRFTLSEDLSPVTKSDLPGEKLHKVYFSRFLAEASRDVVQLYDLKKREYLGTTSMDAELSLVMSNMALVKKDSLVYDPFVGTGSFLVTSAHFGAYTLGSDIDGRQVRGKQGKSIQSNIEQYNFKDQILDTVVFDITHHPWRSQIQFDAIVTDPPYGVRAGAKKLGRKQGNRKLEDIALINGIPAHLNSDYLPPKVNYDMPQVLLDLLNFSANHLTVGGRITFWLPNIVENDEEPIIPSHPCLNLISDCEQAFHGWSRRLITMEKHKQPETPYVSEILSVDQSDVFRNKYFQPNKIE